LVFDAIEPAGLLALVVFDAIESAAVQVQGLLNFVDSVGQATLLPGEGGQGVVRRGLSAHHRAPD